MVQLPTEIWRRVAEEACFPEDRATSFALSLTSHYIHEVSAEFHLHSLCLDSNARVEQYADILAPKEILTPGQFSLRLTYQQVNGDAVTTFDVKTRGSRTAAAPRRPHRFAYIRHLFIQNPTCSLYQARKYLQRVTSGGDVPINSPGVGLNKDHLPRIFRVFASMPGCRLRTYAALCQTGRDYDRWVVTKTFQYSLPTVPVPALPCLVELTITWIQYLSEEADLPGLRRLTVLHPSPRVLDVVGIKAPHITHLRVTPVPVSSAEFLDQLARIAATRVRHAGNPANRAPSPLPPTVQRLIVELRFVEDTINQPVLERWHALGMLSPEERKLEPLKDLASRSEGWLECRILPVASRPWGIDVPADYARGQPMRLMEWQERAREEEGCWAVAEADADAEAVRVAFQ